MLLLREDPMAANVTGGVAGSQGMPPVTMQQQFLYRIMNRIAGVDPTRRIMMPSRSHSDDYEGGYRNYAQSHAPHHHLEHARKMLQTIRARGIHRV